LEGEGGRKTREVVEDGGGSGWEDYWNQVRIVGMGSGLRIELFISYLRF